MKKYAVVAIASGIAFMLLGLWIGRANTSKPSVTVHSPGTAVPGSQAPSEKFLVDYANYKILKQKADDANVDLQGAIGRLNAEVPPGYLLDEKSMQFIPRPATTPTPTPTPKP
jgi:hypothetical protein